MADGNDGHPLFDNKVSSILMAVGSAVFMVTIYRLLSICLFNRHLITNQQDATTNRLAPNNTAAAASSVVSHLIPTHKYEKKRKNELEDDGGGGGGGVGDEADDCTCAVCLGEFEEGEELKTLPECMHSFHVSCIDMWLHSHSSCPICRAEATPQTQLTDDEHHHHNTEMMQIALAQDRLERG